MVATDKIAISVEMVRTEEIKIILQNLPQDVVLTSYGNEKGRGSLMETPTVNKADVDKNVKCFNIDKVKKAVLEIPEVFQRQRSLSKSSSYALKHVLEDETGLYLSNGDFILAMLLSGFDCRFQGCVNPVFNVKRRENANSNEKQKEVK